MWLINQLMQENGMTALIGWIMHEWMNELCFYIAFYCVLPFAIHPKRFTIMSVQHPPGGCDSSHRTMAPVRSSHTNYRWREERLVEPIKWMRSSHTSYRWRGERVIEPIKWMGIIRRPWFTRASGGNLARTPGLHLYSLREVPLDF